MQPPDGRPAATPSIEPPPARLALIDPARVAAVVPAWNETGKIGDVVRKVPRRWAATVIVVDDHSSDDTAGEARAAGAEVVIRHEVNKGVGAGIRTGLLEAKRRGIEFAAILSGDDQHEPDELPRVLVPLFAGEADLAQGSLSLLDDPRIQLQQDWLDRYELEPYLLYQAMRGGYRVTEAPVTVRYHGRGTTKMRLKDGWRILRPLVYL